MRLKTCFVFVLALSTCGWSAAHSVESPRTGFFELTFSPTELLGGQGAHDAADILRSEEDLSWQIFVPPNYDPSKPAGVLVYVSPTTRGGPPRRWNDLLGQKNLIWIGANDAGNRTGVGKRMFLALLGPKILTNDYLLDENRIYVAGFSGGGKTASRVSVLKPEVFRGGIYIGGAESWPERELPPKLDLIKLNRHVFLSGTEDFNERLTRRVYASFQSAGAEHSELMIVPRMGHELPTASVFANAIEYLDLGR